MNRTDEQPTFHPQATDRQRLSCTVVYAGRKRLLIQEKYAFCTGERCARNSNSEFKINHKKLFPENSR